MSAKDMFYPTGKDFSNAEERAFAREELIYNVTEDVLLAIEDLDISKKELARRLGKSRSFVTQILSGARNMTLNSLSDICFAIDRKPKISLTVETAFDTISECEDFHWENESFEAMKDSLIRVNENVIDQREHPAWVTQQAA